MRSAQGKRAAGEYQDGSNPRHEAGDHGVWHLGDVSTQTEHAKKDLKQTRQDDHGEGHGHGRFLVGLWRKLRITDVNTTVMGPVGSEIKVGVPPKRDATKPMITAPKARAGHPLRRPEGQGHRQSNHRGGHATKGVTPGLLVLIRFNKVSYLLPR